MCCVCCVLYDIVIATHVEKLYLIHHLNLSAVMNEISTLCDTVKKHLLLLLLCCQDTLTTGKLYVYNKKRILYSLWSATLQRWVEERSLVCSWISRVKSETNYKLTSGAFAKEMFLVFLHSRLTDTINPWNRVQQRRYTIFHCVGQFAHFPHPHKNQFSNWLNTIKSG